MSSTPGQIKPLGLRHVFWQKEVPGGMLGRVTYERISTVPQVHMLVLIVHRGQNSHDLMLTSHGSLRNFSQIRKLRLRDVK